MTNDDSDHACDPLRMQEDSLAQRSVREVEDDAKTVHEVKGGTELSLIKHQACFTQHNPASTRQKKHYRFEKTMERKCKDEGSEMR